MDPSRRNRNAPDKELRDLLARVEASERRRQERLWLATTHIPSVQTPGERLVPYLCAALEACWISAVLVLFADFRLFDTDQPFMPLWAPFLVLWGVLWQGRRLELRSARRTPPLDEFDRVGAPLPGMASFLLLQTLLAVIICWASLYAPRYPLYDLAWLQALLNDSLLLRMPLYRLLAILVLVAGLTWRGTVLARLLYEPDRVKRSALIGSLVMGAVVLVHAGQGVQASSVALLDLMLLIPLLLYCALLAHALAQAAFVRRSHPLGLEGSPATQERTIFMVCALLGIFLGLLTFSVLTSASAAVLNDLRQLFTPLALIYDWLVALLARLVVVVVSPVVWLLQALHFQSQPPQIRRPQGVKGPTRPVPPPEQAILLARVLAVLVPLLVLAILVWLIVRMLRRRRVRLYERRLDEELHESLWSWALFWLQIRAMLERLLRLLRPRRALQSEAAEPPLAPALDPRGVRAIYRALLREAARRGSARRREETPAEYQRRLDTQMSLGDPRLEVITAAYTAARYGSQEPAEAEAAHLQDIWGELQRRWSSGQPR